ncbi:peptide chain release factor 2 [Patescibacteria group bacterium]|nr:peptide chain release factor 2 [Patescibacteria group bacterium]
MAIVDKQLQELQEKAQNAWEMLHLDASQERVHDLEVQISLPDFWSDQEQAKLISQEISQRQAQIEVWQSLLTEIQDALDLSKLAQEEVNTHVELEVEKTVKDLQERYAKLELQTLLACEMDENNAIISIHAGAGGTDASNWAGMLLRMFIRFAESQGWDTDVYEASESEEAGYKSVSFSVNGRFAYGMLKGEAGVHRLVRISPFDAEKMRHTSFALVEVIPELTGLTDKNIAIDEKDLRIDTFMAGGHGGQGVNTTYSAVRITHIPTNTVVTCQNERSQSQNKESAMRVLKSRLFVRMQEERAEKLDELKGGHKSPQWGNQIRSYVLHPYKLVKDHRTGFETQEVERVLEGDLLQFVESYLREQVAQKSN